MRKIFIIGVVLLALSVNFYAQDSWNDYISETSSKSEKAEKIDEFGRIGNCDNSARLDNFLVQLLNQPSFTGVIIIYKSVKVLPGNEFSYERTYRNHFAYRNFDSSRIEIIDGGFREDFATEIWLVPPGASKPQPSESLPKPELPTNKTFLFDVNSVEQRFYDTLEVGIFDTNTYLYEFILPTVKAEREAEQKALEEQWKSEDSEEPQTIEEETEIEPEKPKTPEEIEEEKFFWTNEKFGEVIKNLKDASGAIIFYADDQVYDIARLQIFIGEGRDKIAKSSGISSAKIRILFGGYRSSVEAEFWIMPKNGAFPTPTPEERPVEEPETDEENL